ncbi:Putative esterase/lipase HI_0193 [Linum perenne]
MSSPIPKFTASGKNGTFLHSVQRSPCLNSPASISQLSLRKPQNDAFGISRLSLKSSSRMVNDRAVRMALVDERRLARSTRVAEPSGVLAYELVQGSLVKWSSSMDKSVGDPPTAVLLHGILGSRKNWGTFAKRLAQEFPMWQFLLVDLRCHGDSASVSRRGPHSVASTALDVLKLVAHLRITPRVLIGHSFGGKVVLSMVDQAAKPLARPIRVTSKREVVSALLRDGFSKDVAQWVVTNLRPSGPPSSPSSKFSWMFDLEGISEMYNSYEETNLWKFVDNLPRGVHLNFLKAERSLHRWALEDLQRIHAAEDIASEEGGGVEMHVLEDAGHWVHTDNPDGLFRILSPSFQGLKT